MVAINENSMLVPGAVRRRTQPPINHLHQGMTLDAVTELYYERNRDYSPSLGRWMEQDPLRYINGVDTYQFVNSPPMGNVDAEGLAASVNAQPLGTGVKGQSIVMHLQVRFADPFYTYTPRVAVMSMHVSFTRNPGGKLPLVTQASGRVTPVGGWGGASAGATPNVSPIPMTFDGHVGYLVTWRPMLARNSSLLADAGSAVADAFVGAAAGLVVPGIGTIIGIAGGAIAGVGQGELSSPSYTVHVSGRWFVWQGCRGNIHIENLSGQVEARTRTPLISETVIVEGN
jgi:RHS repeat-associated protein